MLYLVGAIAILLVVSLVYANVKKNRRACKKSGSADKPHFRTQGRDGQYGKPIDSHQSQVDFEDAE